MCLAHELTCSRSSDDEVPVEEKASVSYCVTVARLHLLLGNFPEAQRYLKSAITKEMAVKLVFYCALHCLLLMMFTEQQRMGFAGRQFLPARELCCCFRCL